MSEISTIEQVNVLIMWVGEQGEDGHDHDLEPVPSFTESHAT
jgi:hypothetical protein